MSPYDDTHDPAMAMIGPGPLAGSHKLGRHRGGHGDGPGDGHGVDGRLMEHALLGTILFILLLTVLFEIGKHKCVLREQYCTYPVLSL